MLIFITVYRKQDHQKVVTRHIWQAYVEEADHLRHHQNVKPIYANAKKRLSMYSQMQKEKHGMRWTTLRGLKKLSMQVMLAFAAINLKKMARGHGKVLQWHNIVALRAQVS